MPKVSRLCCAVVAIVLAVAVQAQAHTIITRMSDKQSISLAELAAAARNSDLILIGEAHDQKYHHDLQIDLLRSLLAGKKRLSIGLEMMQADHQKQLDQWVAGKLTEPRMQAVFERNWTDWELYRDIFIFARDNRIPMVALNVPIHIVRKVSQFGFSSLTPQERGGVPAGTSCDLKNPQIIFLRTIFKAVETHGVNGKMFSNFCEAQTVRNSGMAINMTRYARKNPGGTMVVLTGIWHAVKYGIPDQLQHLGSELSYTVILPETPQMDKTSASTSEADYLVEL